VSYLWQEGDANLSNDHNFSESNFSIGTHTITLTVTDDDGATGTDEINITIAGLLKKTGQTTIYDTNGNVIDKATADSNSSYRDDGYYQKGEAIQYVRDNDTNITTDKVTSLQWEDSDHAGSTTLAWSDAASYCDTLTLGGFSDWRLPTIRELKYIVDLTKSTDPYIDETYFTKSAGDPYWSSTEDSADTSNAWVVDFYSGYSTKKAKTNTRYVRCVRLPQ